jgi:hypothetical protein
MIPNIRTNHCPNCKAQAGVIDAQAEVMAALRADKANLQADKAKLHEALERIARYDVGLQSLIEDGADTPENRAKYYEGRVEYRRSIARAALPETEQ